MLSIIIVAYRTPLELRTCLSSLRLCAPSDSEVIVVDNGGDSATRDLSVDFPAVRWVWNADNMGYAPAARQGALLALGDLLFFLNPDTVVFPQSLPRLMAAFADPEVAAAGPLSNYAAGRQALGLYIDEHEVPNGADDGAAIHRLLGERHASECLPVPLLIGFALMLRRSAYEGVGGMDADLALGMDDLDLSWRLGLAGHKLVVALDAYVLHRGQCSFAQSPSDERQTREEAAHLAFSNKLVLHYGAPEKVPSSRELWDIDWFQLHPDSARTESMPPMASIPLLVDGLGLVVVGSDKARIQQSLQHARALGWSDTDILVLGAGAELAANVLVPMEKDMALVWPLLRRFFATSTRVVFLEAGARVSRLGLPAIHQADASTLATPLQQWTRPGFGLCVVAVAHHQWPDFSTALDPEVLVDFETTLDEGAFMPADVAEDVTYDVQLADLRNLAHWSKAQRLAGEKDLSLSFANGLCQWDGEERYNPEGLSFYEVERCLNQGGWRITGLDGLGDIREEAEVFQGVGIDREGRREWENILGRASHLRVRAVALSDNIDVKPLVSVVLLALNKLEYTRQCIESLLRNTKQALELILVDNGSTDGTYEYFCSVPGAIAIRNDKNLGVAAGWNQGLEKAKGDYVLILNNDTIVPPGAVEHMVRCAMNFPKAGIVAPRSNAIAGPQLLKGDFPRHSTDAIEARCLEIQEQNALSAWQFPRIKGFCMLIPRPVVYEVGYFDEQFGYGNFEDDDYSLRVALAGYDLLVADDSVVFHYGSVSFSQAGIDWNEQMRVNHQLFNKKWDKGRRSLKASAPVKVEKTWADYQASLRGEAADAEVYRAMARLKVEQGDVKEAFRCYCLALEMNSALFGLDAEVARFLESRFAPTESEEVRRFLSVKYPQCTALAPQQTSMGGLAWVEDVKSLLEQGDFDTAQRALGTVPESQRDGFDALNFQGILHYYRGEFALAFQSFEQALRIDPSHADCLLNYCDAGLRLRHYQRVLDTLERSLALVPSLEEVRRCAEEIRGLDSATADPEQLILRRECNLVVERLIREGMLDKAEDEAKALLGDDPGNERAMNNLGLIHWYAGDLERAWERFARAVDRNVFYTDALCNLFDAAALLGRLAAFEPYLARALQHSPYQRELLELRRHLKDGTLPERLLVYTERKQEIVHKSDRLDKAKALIEMRDYSAAILECLSIIDADGESSEAFNLLGLCAWYMSQWEDAFIAFRRAVELSPLSVDGLLNLWDAAKKMARLDEVRHYYDNALNVDPSLDQIRDLLDGEVL